jgi:hypothetical protein
MVSLSRWQAQDINVPRVAAGFVIRGEIQLGNVGGDRAHSACPISWDFSFPRQVERRGSLACLRFDSSKGNYGIAPKSGRGPEKYPGVIPGSAG